MNASLAHEDTLIPVCFFVLWLALLQSVSVLEIIVFVICALVAIADCIAGCVPEYGVY